MYYMTKCKALQKAKKNIVQGQNTHKVIEYTLEANDQKQI